MRKVFFLMAILMALAAFVSAQNTGITSVFNDSSVGIFENELDWAVNVGPEFTTLKYNYLFAGLANLEESTVSLDQTFDNGGNPLWGGFYKAGENPWSAFAGFTASDSTGNQAGGTTYTAGGTTTVGTTTWQWNESSTETTFTANRLFDDMSFAGQYLFMLGDFNTGAYFGMDIDNSLTVQINNYEQTESWYYNSTGGGVIPTPLADYKNTITETDKDSDSTFTLGAPFFMQAGDISHTANVVIDLNLLNVSTTFSDTFSAPADAALPLFTNTEADDVTDKTAFVGFKGDYTLTKPGIWGESSENEFFFGGGIGFDIEIPTYSEILTENDISYAGGGVAGVLAANDAYTLDDTFKAGFDFEIEANAGHSFFFDLGPVVTFGLSPEATLNFSMNNDALRDERVEVDRADNDFDGTFNDAIDRITTTTTTYTNTDSTGGGNTSIIDITTTLSLPVAATIAPEKWPFFVTLGSRADIQLINTITSTKSAVDSVQTVIVEGTGAAVSDTTVNATSSNETSVVRNDIVVEAIHNIGMTMPMGEYVKLDVNLDLSGTTFAGLEAANLLDFRNLVIQVIIALP